MIDNWCEKTFNNFFKNFVQKFFGLYDSFQKVNFHCINQHKNVACLFLRSPLKIIFVFHNESLIFESSGMDYIFVFFTASSRES